MAKFSKDIKDDVMAENAILEIDNAKDLQAFIKGEQREHLLDRAAYRLNLLKQADATEIKPIDATDTTPEWIRKHENLQPKQGQFERISQGSTSDIKGVVLKGTEKKAIVLRDGIPHWDYFDESGKLVHSEKAPGF